MDLNDFVPSIFKAVPDLIWIKDKDLHYVVGNLAFLNACGMTPGDLPGKTDAELWPAEMVERYAAIEAEAIKTGCPIKRQLPFLDQSKKIEFIEGIWIPVSNEKCELVGVVGFAKDITQRKETEAELQVLYREMIDSARQAGMAEIATNILHNIGNILNNMNTGLTVAHSKLKQLKIPSLLNAVDLLKKHSDDLGTYLSSDAQGKQLPSFFIKLGEHFATEQELILQELEALSKNVSYVKEVVASQQAHSKLGGVMEPFSVIDLIEEALQIDSISISQHNIQVTREYGEVPQIMTNKHKLFQVLVNFISNAVRAILERNAELKTLTIKALVNDEKVEIQIIDNGIGITEENQQKLFTHGFTTRKDGHGFGLHSVALITKEMGWALMVESQGHNAGATFGLRIPLKSS